MTYRNCTKRLNMTFHKEPVLFYQNQEVCCSTSKHSNEAVSPLASAVDIRGVLNKSFPDDLRVSQHHRGTGTQGKLQNVPELLGPLYSKYNMDWLAVDMLV